MTLFMAFMATKVQVSSELPKILPKTDSRFQLYESFKKRFGEDGSVMVVGVETDKSKLIDNHFATGLGTAHIQLHHVDAGL